MRLFLATLMLQAIVVTGTSQNIVVAAEKYNTAMVGVENPFSIAVGGVPTNLLVVKAAKGKITEMGNGHYLYFSRQSGEEEIIVYKKENNKLKELGRKKILVKPFPHPEPFIGTRSGGNVSKKFLIAMGGVIAKLIDLDGSLRIDSFTVCINYHDSCAYRSIHNAGNKYSPEVLSALQTLRTNDIIFIKDIYCMLPSGEMAELSPLAFKITDDDKN